MSLQKMKIFYFLFITFLFYLCQNKTVVRSFSKNDIQSGERKIFLTKFDFGQKGGSIRIKTKIANNKAQYQRNFIIEVVIDEQIKQFTQKQCNQTKQLVLRTEQLVLAPLQQVDERKIKIPEKDHQHIHYLYLATCNQNLDHIIQTKDQFLIFEIVLYNDQSHFGEDEKMLAGYLILVSIWLFYLVKYARPIGKAFFDSKDKTKITVFTGLVILGVSYFYRLIHLGIYYSNGKGLYFFEILYIVLKSSCQFIIVTLLVAISWGWSITHLRYDESYILAGVTATLINIVGLIVSVSAQQMADNHHKYDSTAGYILQMLRFLILIMFLVGILRSLSLSVGSTRKFIKKLGLVGTAYLISWPVTVLFSEFFLPNYMHNQIITFVEQITHMVATGILCQMLAHPDSTYRKLSIKEQDNPLKMQNYKRK